MKYQNFQNFNGNPVEQLGTWTTTIEFNEWKTEAKLLVVPDDGGRTPLLGADLIKKLGLKLIQNKKKGQSETKNNVNKDESHKSVLKQKLKKLFDGTGQINNHIVRTKFKTPLKATQQKGRRIPIALQDKVHEEIMRLLKNGHIKKLKACCDEEQFISPIVITVKKDGSLKLVLDSNKLNESVIKNKYQMPNIDELIDQMSQIVT